MGCTTARIPLQITINYDKRALLKLYRPAKKADLRGLEPHDPRVTTGRPKGSRLASKARIAGAVAQSCFFNEVEVGATFMAPEGLINQAPTIINIQRKASN